MTAENLMGGNQFPEWNSFVTSVKVLPHGNAVIVGYINGHWEILHSETLQSINTEDDDVIIQDGDSKVFSSWIQYIKLNFNSSNLETSSKFFQKFEISKNLQRTISSSQWTLSQVGR